MRILGHFQSFRAYIWKRGNQDMVERQIPESYSMFWERPANFSNCSDTLNCLRDLHGEILQSITTSKVSFVYTDNTQ